MANRAILTYKDYEALPDDGRRYELLRGDLSITPAPGTRHQIVLGELFTLLAEHVKRHGLGRALVSPVDCILGDTTVVQPDIVYLDSTRLSRLSARGIEGAPTLAVEVLSPSSIALDRTVKLPLYARHGIPYVWIVDPDGRTIEAFELRGEGQELVGRLAGQDPAALPPFPDLLIVPVSIWP